MAGEPGALQDVALALDSFAQAALEARFVLDTRSTEATTIPDVNPAAM